MTKIIEEYYTPIQIENDYGLSRNTLRKYSNLIDEKNGENYFKRRKIGKVESRIYTLDEVKSLCEVNRLTKSKQNDLNSAIAMLFFNDVVQNNDDEPLDVVEQNVAYNDLLNVLKNQNEIINNQNEILKNQNKKIDELSNKIDDFVENKTLKIESKSEEKKRNFLGFRRKK